jgi:hypothetical protein
LDELAVLGFTAFSPEGRDLERDEILLDPISHIVAARNSNMVRK